MLPREIILDTETTGLDPASGHRIVEIGCVEVIGAVRSGNVFHCYLNPERDMPDEAERIHGLSSKFLKDMPVFAEKIDELLEFLADSPLVIHNAAFDLRFLNAEMARLGFPPFPPARAVDTVALAKKKFPGAPVSLDALCKRFEIDLSSRTKHGALLDAELLADVYLELLGGRQANLWIEKDATTLAASVAAAPRQIRAARIFSPSPEEQAAHTNMLTKLKNPLWQI